MSFGPGYDPRGSGRARRAGQVVQALLGPGAPGVAGTINVANLAPSSSANMVLCSAANTVTVVIDTVGLTQWQCPTGVTAVFAECFGRGGNGNNVGGGGGGEYAAGTVSVTALNFYDVFVGDPSLGSMPTSFNDTSVIAMPGGDATSLHPGTGGTGGTGTTLFDGGIGGKSFGTDDGGGGGGGSSGSEAGAGNTAADATGPGGSAGATAVGTGGAGGNGGTSSQGQNGFVPGGGAGGCSALFPVSGATGAHGRVKLTYTLSGTVTQWQAASSVAPVSSVSNADGSLTISPTTGAIVASLAVGFQNTWTVAQIFSAGILFGTGSSGAFLEQTAQIAGKPTIKLFDNAVSTYGVLGVYFLYDGPSGLLWGSAGTGVWAALNSTASAFVGINALSYAFSSTFSIGLSSNNFTLNSNATSTAPGVTLVGETSTGAAVTAGSVISTFVSPTNATWKSRVTISAGDVSGVREGFRVEGSGSAILIGFFGTSAVIQQTGDVSTGLANLGLFSGTPTYSAAHFTGVLPAPLLTTADLTGQTSTVSSVATVTAPNDGSNHQYLVSCYVRVKTVSAGTITVTCNFTDGSSTARTITFFPMGLSTAGISATGFTGFPSITIDSATNSAITLIATFSGVSVNFDVGGNILQLN